MVSFSFSFRGGRHYEEGYHRREHYGHREDKIRSKPAALCITFGALALIAGTPITTSTFTDSSSSDSSSNNIDFPKFLGPLFLGIGAAGIIAGIVLETVRKVKLRKLAISSGMVHPGMSSEAIDEMIDDSVMLNSGMTALPAAMEPSIGGATMITPAAKVPTVFNPVYPNPSANMVDIADANMAGMETQIPMNTREHENFGSLEHTYNPNIPNDNKRDMRPAQFKGLSAIRMPDMKYN